VCLALNGDLFHRVGEFWIWTGEAGVIGGMITELEDWE
jgi:hypothetical protein